MINLVSMFSVKTENIYSQYRHEKALIIVPGEKGGYLLINRLIYPCSFNQAKNFSNNTANE